VDSADCRNSLGRLTTEALRRCHCYPANRGTCGPFPTSRDGWSPSRCSACWATFLVVPVARGS